MSGWRKGTAMFRRLDLMLQTWLDPVFRDWLAGPRPRHALRETVILHDPAAERPHDLDDPFFDANVQRRVGALIASAMLRVQRPSGRSKEKTLSYSEA